MIREEKAYHILSMLWSGKGSFDQVHYLFDICVFDLQNNMAEYYPGTIHGILFFGIAVVFLWLHVTYTYARSDKRSDYILFIDDGVRH